uniref:CAAX prenyl protease n=1 Tax=Mylabris cichorii TaxID=580878 RepID=A0A1W5KK52_MYLCI|nr:CAAX prenyl protease 1-like protein [Mylabris cichorii]
MNVPEELIIRYAILSFTWAEYLWESYLSSRQYRKVKEIREVPTILEGTITQEMFDKARLYNLAKLQFGFIIGTISVLISTIVITCNIFLLIWNLAMSIRIVDSEILTSCIWVSILLTISAIIELPLTIYYTFGLEEKFGFNKQTVFFFIWDNTKQFMLIHIFSWIITSLIIVLIKSSGDFFFLYLWLLICIMIIVLCFLYPWVIAPVFDKFVPLPEGELRTEIENLATRLNFPLNQLYVVEGSKRSSHSNAYLCGLFKTKRIVLFDTLLAKRDGESVYKNDEILAILTHELGHWKYNHIIKKMIFIQMNLLLLFIAFSFLFKYPPIYYAFGFYDQQPVLIGLIILQYLMIPYNILSSFLMNYLSRKFELQADLFAVELNRGEPLIRALIQMNKDNLGFPIYDDLYSAWHHSHPPLLKRIAILKRAAQIRRNQS